MVAKCNLVEEAAEGQFLYRSARHPGSDSPLRTYTACMQCHIASGGPIRMQMAPSQPAGWPIACKTRHRIGILQKASLGLAMP